MSSLVLIDTSVLLNMLNVPGRNQNVAKVESALAQLIEDGDNLFIPMAAIIETGNHIAHVSGGCLRRQAAERFTTQVRQALNNEAPWKPINFPNSTDVLVWLSEFPDSAMRKVGMGDLSIRKEWERLCEQYPMSHVRVWTLDGDLHGLDHHPAKAPR